MVGSLPIGSDCNHFHMVVQLLADGGRTVYSSSRPDPELVNVLPCSEP